VNKPLFSLFVFILLVSGPGASFCQEEGLSSIVESKYFSVYSHRNIDVSSLLAKLDFNYFIHLDSLAGTNHKDLRKVLAKTLDALYLEVSDILDIHIYSYHGNIKIVPDKDYLNSIFRKYHGRDFPERSFYMHENNTVYISYADLSLGMLGHEISHAIISHFFVVPPPVKIQEVLSGYVEYSLRKSTGTLP